MVINCMKLHEKWLLKAKHDLSSSKKLFEGVNPIYDTAIYHTQQCAEKALKAFLVYQEQEIEKIHDVSKLLKSCSKFDKSFLELKDDALTLTPYATEFRYPDDCLEPDKEDVEEAIKMAEKIYNLL